MEGTRDNYEKKEYKGYSVPIGNRLKHDVDTVKWSKMRERSLSSLQELKRVKNQKSSQSLKEIVEMVVEGGKLDRERG